VTGTLSRISAWKLVVVAGAAAVLLLLAVAGARQASSVRAATTWNVQAGAMAADGVTQALAFFPDPLAITVGDTVAWTSQPNNPEPHTVTFNSGKPDLALLVPGPGQGDLTLGPAFFPAGVAGTSVAYDGTKQISSGANLEPGSSLKFSVTFSTPGIFDYVCTIHPGMRGQIIVLPAGVSLPETPDQAATRGKVTADYLLWRQQNEAKAITSASAGGAHTAALGIADAFGTASQSFLPGNLTVKRGDTITWTNADAFEPHTVTFVGPGATPPDFVVPKPNPNGPPTLYIPAATVAPAGGDTFTGQGVVNSGLLFGAGTSYALKIDAPPGTYTFYCVIHGSPQGGMRGTVTVTP